jgi:hypothetical protein
MLALLAARRAHAADYASCRELVFTGLSADCNFNAAGSVSACCRRLAATEAARCFCQPDVVTAVVAAVGPDGVGFFASFARTNCGFNATVGAACPLVPSPPPSPAPPSPVPPGAPQVVAPPRAPQVRCEVAAQATCPQASASRNVAGSGGDAASRKHAN